MITDTLEFDSPELDKALQAMESETSALQYPTNTPNRNKTPVVIQLHDGSLLEGDLVIGTNHRLSDYLNQAKTFVVLTDIQGEVHILNRAYIVKVTEQ